MKAEAYLINPAQRKIERVEIDPDETKDYYRHLECENDGFCLGHMFTGEPVYVAENSMRKPNRHFFQVLDEDDGLQPLPGNGLMTGRDRYTRGGDNAGLHPIEMTIEELAKRIRFMTRARADAWAARQARRPAFIINGEVIQTFEQVWRQMPDAPDQPPVRLLCKMPGDTEYGEALATLMGPFGTVWQAIDCARGTKRARDEKRLTLGALLDHEGGLLLTKEQLAEVIA